MPLPKSAEIHRRLLFHRQTGQPVQLAPGMFRKPQMFSEHAAVVLAPVEIGPIFPPAAAGVFGTRRDDPGGHTGQDKGAAPLTRGAGREISKPHINAPSVSASSLIPRNSTDCDNRCRHRQWCGASSRDVPSRVKRFRRRYCT